MFCFIMATAMCGDAELFSYFLDNKTEKCWILDRDSNRNVVSCAATGFGFSAWALMARNGTISRAEAVSWINQGIDNMVAANPKNHGWLYHWLDRDGNPSYNKEVSTIDTALFYWGARKAAAILKDKPLQEKVERLISSIDRSFMKHTQYYCHGLIWDGDRPAYFIEEWRNYSEGVLLYGLFGEAYEPPVIDHSLPMFCFYYPLCFQRDEKIVSYLKNALDYQKSRYGTIGYTACDGPHGYRVMEDGVVSPLAVRSIEPFFPAEADSFFSQNKVDKNTPSLHLKSGWRSRDRIGIDIGACLLVHYSI